MQTLELIETAADTIEPGSPVHDAVYNFVSTVRNNYNNTDTHTLLGYVEKIAKVLSKFASLEEEHQWTVEEDIAHAINSVTAAI